MMSGPRDKETTPPMPWSDNSDQGSKPGPKPGPWGAPTPPAGGRGEDANDTRPPPRGPQGGGPRRPTPPSGEDLNALLLRLRRRFNELMGAPGGEVPPRLIGALVAAGIAVWFISGIYTVQPAEQAVVTTFGAYSRSVGPGPHWRFRPIERYEKVSIGGLKKVDIGGTPDAEAPMESLMLTGDENIVDLEFTVQYRVNDATKYLFSVKDPDDMVKAVAESSVREIVGKSPLQSILTTGRGKVQDQTADLMQKILDNYGSGVTVVEVQIRSANPPAEVIPDFQAVASAGQYADSAVNEANAYSNKVVNEAKGDAAKIVQSAQGYREQTVREAEGDADRFNQIYEQYRRAPAITRQRLYLETMERVLGKSNKVIVDGKGTSAPIILPPDAFKPRTAAAPAPPPPPPAQPDPSLLKPGAGQ
jgi:membrane protease subunit HflK